MRVKSSEEQDVFHLLDVNPQAKKMEVLRALVEAGKNEARVGFSDILKHLRGDDTEEPNKSLIYRLLGTLEDDGFIEVDRSGYRHRYSSNLERIRSALKKKRDDALDDLSERRTTLERRLERLQNIGINLLVDRVTRAMTDINWTDKSRFGMGLRSLQLMADREVYAPAIEGDVVRITVDDVDLKFEQWNERLEIFGNLASRGIKVRVLFEWPCRYVEGAWENTKREYISIKREGLDVDFRIRTGELTYQMVARNADILVLTVAEEPLASICVPRDENPTLLDDVVDSFDSEFFSSVGLLEGDKE